ncbi:MAG: VWA domain-containing protein [Acidimicrobiia bacterium]|nr:VWA domain-containing protein [Acidimicrobiia bacterium]
MLEFEYLWVFVLLPAPIFVWLLFPPYRERQESVRIPRFEQLAGAIGGRPTHGAVVLRRNWLQGFLAPLCWILIVIALARPVWIEPPIERIESARDLLLAVDLSGSMETQDMRDSKGQLVDRLEAVKLVLDDFIIRRPGDRIGLLFFGTAPFVQVGFTLDHEIVRTLLDEAEVAMPGPQTMMGDAIGLAIKVFENSEAKERVLVLLTDGVDTGSKVPPEKAADLAGMNGLTIHTIGFGDPTASGEDLIDSVVLEAIAKKTEGRSFMADDREALEAVYRQLDELEPQNFETLSYRPVRPLYVWPLGAALVLLLLYHVSMTVWLAFRSRMVRNA